MNEMSNTALEARRAYQKRYRAEHREAVQEYAKTWRANNKDKVKAYQKRYWEKKAAVADCNEDQTQKAD